MNLGNIDIWTFFKIFMTLSVIAIVGAHVYNTYLASKVETFEEAAKDTKQTAQAVVAEVEKKPNTKQGDYNEELMSRLEIVTSKLETLINIFNKKKELFNVDEEKEKKIEDVAKDDTEDEEEEPQKKGKSSEVHEAFTNPFARANNVNGYDNYLYNNYSIKL